MRLPTPWRLALLVLTHATLAQGQRPNIAIIDFYGVRTTNLSELREALALEEGTPAPDGVDSARTRLLRLPGVARVSVSGTCCDNGGVILYVGIEEEGGTPLRFRRAPTGTAELPAPIVSLGEAFDSALTRAVERGVPGDDESEGYSLMVDSAARAIQRHFIPYATAHAAELRNVLRTSSNADQRALAAQVLAYGPRNGELVADLVWGMSDPSSVVRNSAMRALWVLAKYLQEHEEAGLQIPTTPFVALLNSLEWTDRNKSSLALMEFTERRDPALLKQLRTQALPSLIEMARWKSKGHAAASFFILGRIAGWPESRIGDAWARGSIDDVVAAAERTAASRDD